MTGVSETIAGRGFCGTTTRSWILFFSLTIVLDFFISALAESTGKRAVELLFDHVTSIEQDFDISIRERGVVANRIEETNEATEMMEWFARAFNDTPRFEVRKRVALQRAHSAEVWLFEYDPEVDMCDVFLDIAAELDEQFGSG